MLLNCLAVGCGGFAGCILRYLLMALTPETSFPWVTIAINIVGSFVLAALITLALDGAIANERVSLMLRVGFCGGFTTLSTFSYEVLGFVSNGAWGIALGYSVATCVLCVLASFAGCMVVKPLG